MERPLKREEVERGRCLAGINHREMPKTDVGYISAVLYREWREKDRNRGG